MNRDAPASKSEFSLRHYFRDDDQEENDDVFYNTDFSFMNKKWNTDSTICERSRSIQRSLTGNDYRTCSRKGRTKPNVYDLQVKITPCSDDEGPLDNDTFTENSNGPNSKARRSSSVRMKPCKSTGDVSYLPFCRVTDVDTNRDGKTVSRLKNIEPLIARERRRRIQKLQSDLLKIQNELRALSDLEYEVSDV